MESKSLDNAIANITAAILDLQSNNKLQDSFQDTMQAVLAVGNDWKSKGNDGVPLTYKVIEGLASTDSGNTLAEYLRALTKKQSVDSRKLQEGTAKNASESHKRLIQKVHDIVTEWVENDICSDMCPNATAIDILRTHLLAKEQCSSLQELPEEHSTILSLYGEGNIEELKEHLQRIVANGMQPEHHDTKYESEIKKVVTIVFAKIDEGHFEDVDDKMSCFTEVLTYLNEKEEQWNQQAAKFDGDRVLLPPVHRAILTCYESGNVESLIQLLRKVVKDSFRSFSLQRIQNKFKILEDELEKKGTFTGEQVVALLGTTITVGLSTLHQILPTGASAFKSLITQFGSELATPAFSSWGVISGLSGATVVGICIYNAYCVCRGTKTVGQAGKHIVDSVVPMAIASGVGIFSALTFASVAHPIWISMATFATTGLLVYLLLAPLVSQITNWLFFDRTRHEELQRAFQILGIDESATDEEVRRAYRNRLRENHPDTINRTRVTPNQIAEARERFFEIQRAFEFIVTTRIQDVDINDEEGILARIRNFFTSQFSTDSSPTYYLTS